ncbi:TPA: flagella basal body P-ring formation protein FlgA, partial [Legionella pneumophila]|nr:flagella basal body P-ring formation protein FlgA [Legionella pneumophila]
LGDSVKVKNLSSKRIIEAQVTGKKTVKVIF